MSLTIIILLAVLDCSTLLCSGFHLLGRGGNVGGVRIRSPESFSLLSPSSLSVNGVCQPMRLGAVPEASPTLPSAINNKFGRSSMIPFYKFQGLGNDFVLMDNRSSRKPLLSPEQSAKLCDRNLGVGGDGVIFALSKGNNNFEMRIYNSDGSEPEMCGNGIRCMTVFLAMLEGGIRKEGYKIATGAGDLVTELHDDGMVTVDMGVPILQSMKVPTTLPGVGDDSRVIGVPLEVGGELWKVTCVSMGNPHAIVFVPDLGDISLETVGPKFETHDSFPAKINTEFVQVLSREHLVVKVWERGAGATRACGTGACAVVVAAVLNGLAERKCKVTLPGGDLEIEWREQNGRVYMTGPAIPVFSGSAYVCAVEGGAG